MKNKAYRAVDVNSINPTLWLQQRHETVVHAGLDVGKDFIFCTLRWGAADFDRPWRIRNPSELLRLAKLLREVGQSRQLR